MDEPYSLLNYLNAKSPKSLKMVLHGFELFGGVSLPILDLTHDPKRIPGAAESFCNTSDKTLPPDCKLRRVKYLNNVIEQYPRFVKKKVRASQCFKTFHMAERTLEGVEAMNMMRKEQVKRLSGNDIRGQAKFVSSLFQIAA